MKLKKKTRKATIQAFTCSCKACTTSCGNDPKGSSCNTNNNTTDGKKDSDAKS